MTGNENMSVDYPPRPENPCWACGGDDWWLRPGPRPEWLCNRCHPNPYQGRLEKGLEWPRPGIRTDQNDGNSAPGSPPDSAIGES